MGKHSSIDETVFRHSMPGLGIYRFDDEGRCVNMNTGNIMTVFESEGKYDKRYFLKDDRGKQHSVRLKEVKQYIGHLIEVETFDPTVGYHYVCYRPRPLSYYKSSKPLTDKQLDKLINAA